MNRINDAQKNRIRTRLINGDRNYNKNLNNKVFLVLCDDGYITSVSFSKMNFKHMSGVKSDLLDEDFYNHALKGTLDLGNILSDQKYDISTLKKKTTAIEGISDVFYKDGNKVLLIDSLKTHTYTFPVALRNIQSNICVGFVGASHVTRSLRKDTEQSLRDNEKRVLAIFEKINGNNLYDKIVYISDVKKLYDKNNDLVNMLGGSVEYKLLEILTKPE